MTNFVPTEAQQHDVASLSASVVYEMLKDEHNDAIATLGGSKIASMEKLAGSNLFYVHFADDSEPLYVFAQSIITVYPADREYKAFIYVNGKFTPCTLDEMIQQYIDGYQHRYDHNSDERPWLTHLIDLLIAERKKLEMQLTEASKYSRNPEELNAIAYRNLLELGNRGQLILDRNHLLLEVDARDRRIASLETQLGEVQDYEKRKIAASLTKANLQAQESTLDMHWLHDHYIELLEKYEGEWVAIIHQALFGHAQKLADLKKMVDDAQITDIPFVHHMVHYDGTPWIVTAHDRLAGDL